MKIRIKGNSLRFRLTRQETAQLAAEGSVENETEIAGQVFRYAVQSGAEAAVTSAFLDPYRIRVVVPAAIVASWATSEAVGFYAEQPTPGGGSLSIAVEKDFRCLDPRRDEDESDHFENPLAGQTHDLACAPGAE